DNYVYALALQLDDKILLSGYFTFINGTNRNRIARLNTDGSLDSSFDPGTGANNYVYPVAAQPDGKVLIGGNFTFINETNRNRVARLNIDGSLDTTFDPGDGPSDQVNCLALQTDGKVVIGGNFTRINNTNRNYIARLNADGSLDDGFNPGA